MMSRIDTIRVIVNSHSFLSSAFNSYSRELPSRFKKDIVRAAKNEDNAIALDAMERVLRNIGANLSHDDLEIIFSEIGESGVIPAERMTQIL
jgi:Ca2+-binding EF-hand superfamily protein